MIQLSYHLKFQNLIQTYRKLIIQNIQYSLQKLYSKITIHTIKYQQHNNMNNSSQSQQNEKEKENNNLDIDIFRIAFNQRKRVNLDRLSIFIKDRHNSLIERRRIYLLIQDTLFEKIQATRQTIKQFIRFFEDILSWYQYFIKNIKKNDLDKKTKQICQFQLLQKTICKIQQLNSTEIGQLESLISWIEKTVLTTLKSQYDSFKDTAKILRKQVLGMFNDAESSRHSQYKFYMKIQDSNDLLENQIYLIDKIQMTNNYTVQWGLKLFQNWKKLLKRQTEVRQSLKTNILEYNKKYCKIYHINDTNKNIEMFWKKINKQTDIKSIFSSFLDEKQFEFILFGTKSRKFEEQYQEFIKLTNEEKRVGSMMPLIDILQNKYFICKIQKQKKEWIQNKLYFSLDQHILIFDEEKKKLLLKINSKGVQTKLVSENILELIGIETGKIFDSTRKNLLHFNTVDQMEELSFYIENIMEENNPTNKNE